MGCVGDDEFAQEMTKTAGKDGVNVSRGDLLLLPPRLLLLLLLLLMMAASCAVQLCVATAQQQQRQCAGLSRQTET
jgi:hypothetical protein